MRRGLLIAACLVTLLLLAAAAVAWTALLPLRVAALRHMPVSRRRSRRSELEAAGALIGTLYNLVRTEQLSRGQRRRLDSLERRYDEQAGKVPF